LLLALAATAAFDLAPGVEAFMRKLALAAGAAAAVLLSSGALAANPSIVVGNDILIPSTPNQTIQLMVTGGTQVAGLDLNVEIASGGTVNGGTNGPKITGVNLTSGTIFAGNNAGQQDFTAFPTQAYEGSIITSSGSVAASGLLASLTIDTTGFTGQSFSLQLGGFSNGAVSGNTDFATPDPNGNPIPANITNGHVVATLQGDANLDGNVNSADLQVLLFNLNKTGTNWSSGDFNADGQTNSADLQILLFNLNRSVTISADPALSASAVPEPLAAGLLLPALALLCSRRRK
jgi:hypothetical protein